MKTYILLACTLFAGLFMACNKEEVEPYDHPFFHIHMENQDTVMVRANRKDQVDYSIYLSAKRQFEPITVKYSVIAKGLEEGVHYQLLNTSDELLFSPGVFEMPVGIQWMEGPLDPAQENSLIIKIDNNSKNYTLGLPGPDQLQQQLVIIRN
ncbi:hypothetical protein AAG747_16240 [Rapidithrix thailandica]|uniref:DUF4843 domain-containing protein n=1 Tax=Rapidithrix thailandica TaxID=413964 RepID=A0AAW9S920_9BACT